jgi:hypothetical protein
MRSKLLKKLGATVPVVNKPSGQRISYEEAVAALFPTDAEEEAAIAEAILEDDRGESIPWEQCKAEWESQLEALEAQAMKDLSK